MNFYIKYLPDGTPYDKIQTEGEYRGADTKKVTEAEFMSVDLNVISEINELKTKLKDTDYIACKIAEGAATVDEYKLELEHRQNWRDRINELSK